MVLKPQVDSVCIWVAPPMELIVSKNGRLSTKKTTCAFPHRTRWGLAKLAAAGSSKGSSWVCQKMEVIPHLQGQFQGGAPFKAQNRNLSTLRKNSTPSPRPKPVAFFAFFVALALLMSGRPLVACHDLRVAHPLPRHRERERHLAGGRPRVSRARSPWV